MSPAALFPDCFFFRESISHTGSLVFSYKSVSSYARKQESARTHARTHTHAHAHARALSAPCRDSHQIVHTIIGHRFDGYLVQNTPCSTFVCTRSENRPHTHTHTHTHRHHTDWPALLHRCWMCHSLAAVVAQLFRSHGMKFVITPLYADATLRELQYRAYVSSCARRH